ncbi:MAG: diguanylate cyclase [Vicinamibacterales bacterium]
MADRPLFEGASRVFTPETFAYVMDSELKRALRSRSYLTLVVLDVNREWEGMVMAIDDGTLQELAMVVAKDVRDTDVIGRTEGSALGLLLLDAEFEQARRVVDRVVARLEDYRFPVALRVAVGAAGYPQHGTDAASLTREALTRPLVNWRRPDRGWPDRN